MAGWIPVSGSANATSGDSAFKIYAQFSQVLDPARVNISSFILRLSGSSTNLSGDAFRDTLDTTRAVFVPSSGIFGAQSPATSAWYTPIILGSGNAVGLRNLEGFFAATVSGSFLTATAAIPPDTTPPVVSGTVPLSGSTGFAVSGNVTLTFSESVQSGTVTTSNVKIRVSGAGSDVAAAVTLASDLITATINPTANLSGNTIYRGFVHPAIKDLAGNTMAASFSWSFTTINPTAPIVSGTTPSNGATSYDISGTPVVVFNTPMQSGSFSGQIKLRISGVGSDVAATIAVSSNLTTVKITPTTALSYCKVYNGFIHNTVKEQLGVTPMVASYTWSFSTTCPSAPVVIDTDPNSGDSAVATSIIPRVSFNTEMASSSITTNSYHIRVSGSSTDIAGTAELESGGVTIKFTPNTSLPYYTTFNGYVDNTVKEVLGVTSMAASFSWSFSTVLPSFTSIYNVTQTGTDHHALDDNRFRIGLRVQGGSPLIGHTVKKVTLRLRQAGSPLSGIGYIRIRSSSGSAVQATLGTFNPSELPTSFTDIAYTNLSADYAFVQNDKVLVEWTSGTATDLVRVAISTAAPFVGAVLTTYDGLTFSGASFADQTGEDLEATLYELS